MTAKLIIDARCHCADCEARTQATYQMIGSCLNCRTQGIVITYRRGDWARLVECPVCGCRRSVEPRGLVEEPQP